MARQKKERHPVTCTVEFTVFVSNDANVKNAVQQVLTWARVYDKDFKYKLVRTSTGEIFSNCSPESFEKQPNS